MDTDELRTINAVGAPVRQSDFDFLLSDAARNAIDEEGIILLDYRPLQAVWRKV